MKTLNNFTKRALAVLMTAAMLVMTAVPWVFAEDEQWYMYNDTINVTIPEGYSVSEEVYDDEDFIQPIIDHTFLEIATVSDDDYDTIGWIHVRRDDVDEDASPFSMKYKDSVIEGYESRGRKTVAEFLGVKQSSKELKLDNVILGNSPFAKCIYKSSDDNRILYWTFEGNTSLIIETEGTLDAEKLKIMDDIVQNINVSDFLDEYQYDDPKLVSSYWDDGEDDGYWDIIAIPLIIILSIVGGLSKSSRSGKSKKKDASPAERAKAANAKNAAKLEKRRNKNNKNKRKNSGSFKSVDVVVEPMHSDDECWGHEDRPSSYRANGTILEGDTECFGQKSSSEIRAFEKERKRERSRAGKTEPKKHSRRKLFSDSGSTGLRLNGKLYKGGTEPGVGVKLDGKIIDTSTEEYESICGDYKANLDALYDSGLLTISQQIEMEEKYDADMKRRGGK